MVPQAQALMLQNASGPVNTGDTGSLGYVFAFLIAGSIFVTIMAKKEEHNKIFID